MLALPAAARACSNASAAYDRILSYLSRPPVKDARHALASQPGVVELLQLPVGPKTVIDKWRADAGSLWVFLGPVGAFKSTILEKLAGHGDIPAGASVSFGGRMSYMPQAVWIQQATIKENIVCNEAWDEDRYAFHPYIQHWFTFLTTLINVDSARCCTHAL
jgi:hypothetical protein